MKKIFITIVTLLAIVIFPTSVFAADGQLISGPSGPQSNGWYSSNPTIKVDSSPACPTGASGSINVVLQNGEGKHHITLRSHMNSYPRIYRDDDYNGMETTGEIFSCPALSQPYQDVDPIVFWQGDIKMDLTPPSISIGSPANNSNTSSSSVTVSGTANDSVSGVQSVVINGVSASLNGTSYSANVPVSLGLNTLTATVKDYAGHTSQAQVVINRIAPTAGSTSANQQSGNNNQQTSNGSQASTNPVAAQSSDPSNPANKDDNKDSTPPTLVKGVVQGGGIGLASILAVVVILLILDKFRIIEIKAFSKITNRISKPTKKTSKKSS